MSQNLQTTNGKRYTVVLIQVQTIITSLFVHNIEKIRLYYTN